MRPKLPNKKNKHLFAGAPLRGCNCPICAAARTKGKYQPTNRRKK